MSLRVVVNDNGNYKSDHSPMCSQIMGNWGLWQFKTTFIVYLTKILAAWFTASLLFTAPQPWIGEYQCNTTNFKNSPNWTSATHPIITLINGTKQPDYCHVVLTSNPNVNHSLDIEDPTVRPCESFSYNVYYTTSLITQFNLLCSRSYLIEYSQCLFFLGYVFGEILATQIMKIISPGNTLINGYLFLLLFGSLAGLSTHYLYYLVLRFLAGLSCGMSVFGANTLITHITGGKPKTIVIACTELFWSIGILILVGIGYSSNNWSHVYVYITTPIMIYMILWNLITDSPIWHMKRNHIDRVEIILKESIMFNGQQDRNIRDVTEMLQNEIITMKIRKQQYNHQNNWRHLFSLSKSLLNFIMLLISWSFILTSYYGLLFNVRNFERQHLFYSVSIIAACEIVGLFIGLFVVLKSEKKWKIIGALTFVCGILDCIILSRPTYADGSHMYVDLMALTATNKIGISACLCLLVTSTVEIFPEPHKKRVVYVCKFMAEFFVITSLFIGWTVKYNNAIPLLIYGLLTAISGICVFFVTSIKTKSDYVKILYEG